MKQYIKNFDPQFWLNYLCSSHRSKYACFSQVIRVSQKASCRHWAWVSNEMVSTGSWPQNPRDRTGLSNPHQPSGPEWVLHKRVLFSFFYSWCTCRNSFTDSELFVYANWRSSLIWPVQWAQKTELNLSLTETREEKMRNFLPKVQIREPTAGVSSVFFCVSIITGQLHFDCVGLFKLPDVATLLLVNVCVVRLCTLPTCWHKPVSEPTATIHYLSCSQLPPPAHCRAPDNKGSHTWTEWQHEVKGWIKLPSLLVCFFFFLFFMTALGHKRLTW